MQRIVRAGSCAPWAIRTSASSDTCTSPRQRPRQREGEASVPRTRYIRPVPHILAIANQKGGVGKTTTAVNLAASLAVAEQRTLLIDGDPQGNATSGIGLARDGLDTTVYDLLLGGATAAESRRRSVQFKHLDVLPATPDLAGAEVELINRARRDQAMHDALAPIANEYDYILIDCPPS